MSKLSLTARKNIQDNEPKRTTHLKTISEAVGIDFETEVDWLVFAPVAEEKGYKDRAGGVIYDNYLKAVASNIKIFAKDAVQKEAFIETFKEKHTIAFILEPVQEKGTPYANSSVWTSNNAGVLNVHIPTDCFNTNSAKSGDDLSKTCSGDSPVTVATRKNIQDQDATLKKHLERLNKATGLDFELQVDWVPFAINAKARGYEDRAGQIVYGWYLGAVVEHIEKLCKDNMSKEALVESVEKKAIAFKLEDDASKVQGDSETKFVDGTLVVTIPTERMCTNYAKCGSDIESRL